MERACNGKPSAEQCNDCGKGEEIADGCHDFAYMLLNGLGMPKDAARASQLFQRSCDMGLAQGCEQVALLYQSGTGVTKDVPKSMALLDQACRGDDLNACNWVGVAYEEGKLAPEVPKDEARAAGIYDGLCNKGFSLGCSNLGELARDGRGVPKDEARAFELFSRACDQKDEFGCDNLAQALEKRPLPDFGRITQLYELSCGQGVDHACQALAKMKNAKGR
jgi:hypothetical protein